MRGKSTKFLAKETQLCQQQDLSRVQFFSSASQIQSSLNGSQIQFAQAQIYQESNLIFLSLQKELKPQLTSQIKQKLQNILHRAYILHNFTIPEQIQAQENLNIQTNQMTIHCQRNINNLVQKYQKYTSSMISYNQFYSLYKNYSEQNQFKKNKQIKQINKSQNIHFQFTQKIEINHVNQNSKLRQSNYQKNNIQTKQFQVQANTQNNGKNTGINMLNYNDQFYKCKIYNKQLIQKVFNLKKQLRDLSILTELKSKESTLNFNRRLNKIIEIKLHQIKGHIITKNNFRETHFSKYSETQQRYNTEISQNRTHTITKQSSKKELMEQLLQANQNLNKQIIINRQNIQKIIELQKQNDKISIQNIKLKQELQRTQNIDTSKHFKFIEQNDNFGKQNQKNDIFRSIKKRNQILITDIRLLKKQLHNQREKNHDKILASNLLKDTQLCQLRESLLKKNQKIIFLQLQSDQNKTKRIIAQEKLQKSEQNYRKIKLKTQKQQSNIQSLKGSRLTQNKQFLKTGESFYQSQQLLVNSNYKAELLKSADKLKYQKYKVFPYLSDVLQGFVYYKCLQKQFRYRYRRACLKQKQLLYRKDGLQVGIISKLDQLEQNSNRIKFTVFLTNYGRSKFCNIQLSVISSNAHNKCILQNPHKKYSLEEGNQCKVNLEYQVNQYPLGSLVLCVEIEAKQIRLLLPGSIVKMFKFNQVKLDIAEMQNGTQKLTFISDKKVYKEFQTLVQYLTDTNIKFKDNQKVCLRCDNIHTGTKVALLVKYNSKNDEITIFYFKQEGNIEISDYLVKTLKFLLQKQKS